MPVKPPFLILEAGLHGDGWLQYYELLVRYVRSWWTGWPRIVFKIQVWRDANSPWANKVRAIHGRPPLDALDENDAIVLASLCHAAGLGFCVTVHDTQSIGDYLKVCDYLKLGSFGAADIDLCARAYDTGIPIIASNCLIPGGGLFANAITLTGVSAYPANQPWDRRGDGYTAHNVPELATALAVDAAKDGARVIEIHTSDRPLDARPQPGDMCVSVRPTQFYGIATELGRVWNACQTDWFGDIIAPS